MTRLEQMILDNLFKYGDVVVVISGRSCSGKTTLAEQIACVFNFFQPVILSLDDWFKDLNDMPLDEHGHWNLDSVDSYQVGEFIGDVRNFLTKGYTCIPSYDIARNLRLSKDTVVKKSSLTIIEGLYSAIFIKDLDNEFSIPFIYVYMDTELSICLDRRVRRDMEKFHVTREQVEYNYMHIVEPNYIEYDENLRNVIKIKGEWGIFTNG